MPVEPELEPVHLPQPVVCVRRWTGKAVLAAMVFGALSALAAALVRLGFRGLQWVFTSSAAAAPVAGAHLALWRRALTPVAGALLATAVLWWQRWQGKRTGEPIPRDYVEYVAAVRHHGGEIPPGPNGWRTASAACSVSSGAAVGREGSMIQFAAVLASWCGRWRGWRDPVSGVELSFLVACGVAGGVTTAYNAPLASIFFAAEIVLGGIDWKELPLLGLASGMGWLVSGTLLGWKRLYPTAATLPWNWTLLLLPLLAVSFGVLGPAYQWLLGLLRGARRLPLPLLWSGAVVGVCSLADPRVWGNGDVGLSAALGCQELPGTALGAHGMLSLLGLRLLATVSCVWTGTVGGVFTPTLFAGGAVGSLLGALLPGNLGVLWAIAGMSFLMAAVTHAPLMAALMAVELTGDWKLLPVLLPLNFVAWQVSRRLSPRAMYAIASQAPASGPAVGRRTRNPVE